MLSTYFRTSRVISFIRQLYIYNFKGKKVNKVNEYKNIDFIKGKYSELVNLKKRLHKVQDNGDGPDPTNAEYIKLSKNYDDLWMKTLDLKEKINELINVNHALLLNELNNRFDYIDRIKSTMISFTIQLLYTDGKSNDRIKERVDKYNKTKEFTNSSRYKSFNEIEDVSDTSKREIHAAFFEVNDHKSHIAMILEEVLRSFNDKFFKVDFEQFYDKVVNYFVKDEESSYIRHLPNLHILTEVKKLFDQLNGIVLSNYFSEAIKPLYENIQCKKSVEILKSKAQLLENQKSVNDSFSVRTLRHQLGFLDLDLFSYIRFDFD